jgi:hypothetical protein
MPAAAGVPQPPACPPVIDPSVAFAGYLRPNALSRVTVL